AGRAIAHPPRDDPPWRSRAVPGARRDGRDVQPRVGPRRADPPRRDADRGTAGGSGDLTRETPMTQRERVASFRRMHENGPLLLPNAWDAASARVIELAGAQAIGTTSAGVSWAYGRRDGHRLRRDEMIDAIRRIVEAVEVPVTADIEGGYGTGSIEDVAETVRAVVELGVVG